MNKRLWRASAVVSALVCLTAAGVAAERPDRPDAKGSGVRHTPGVARPVGPTSGADATIRPTAILGNAWSAENTPLPDARLRLRNVLSGKVQAATVSNANGQFGFADIPAGSYVVELVNGAGRTEVVGHVFTIAQGETVATFVRLTTKVPWFNGFFSNTASAVAASAASEGVTAIAPVARSVSPRQ